MNPFYISGLSQADGCFFVAFEKRKQSKFGLRIRPKFVLTGDLTSKAAFELIKQFFGGIGNIYENPKKHSIEFVVDSIPDLWERIIPHFQKFSLYGEKEQSFYIFKNVVQAILEKKHYNKEVLAHLVELSFAMNRASQRSQEQLNSILQDFQLSTKQEPTCKEAKLAERMRSPPVIRQSQTLQDSFIVGLIEGDGCFSVSFLAKKRILLGFHITGALTKSQLRLFLKIKRRFGNCGFVTRKRTVSKSYCRFQVDSVSDLKEYIIPFMDQHRLYTEKAVHYAKFKRVVALVEKRAHLDQRGFLEIIDIAYEMNLHGKRRKLSKQEYLEKYVI